MTAPLCGKQVEFSPAPTWRQSTMRKLRVGDFDAFMEDILSPDSYDIYLDLDPTNDEVNEFMEVASEAGGESLGKSSGPRASSRTTRRR
ncbi:hypothetical protein OG897_13675 [Streptomyces sp. NBC_00237]|uniref:hypothetical protein n=1 Tax=Streptomyces sp. NBC_00237 TaxID=2975687 RepID=UPI00224D39C2|nr:hypothetical protein [Streptomyces sp. NBC_00237]MCX5202493.1 hypothetical protein [Streptomyces sp. NBC_00237]